MNRTVVRKDLACTVGVFRFGSFSKTDGGGGGFSRGLNLKNNFCEKIFQKFRLFPSAHER